MTDLAIYLWAGAAVVIAALATPAFARLARRLGLVVQPRADRWHRSATPLLGGAAVALAVLIPLGALLPPSVATYALIFGAAAAFALGLVDDFRRIAPSTKLAGQAVIGAGLYVGGIRVEIVELAPIAFVLTLLWVVAIMNAVNLMDNMDGLAAGVAAIAAAALAVSAGGTPLPTIVAAVTAAAAAGFLLHNSYPAKVFMGDAGSLLLGYLLAATALLHTAQGATNVALAVLGPLAVLALPLFDTLLVTLSRRAAGLPVTRGGRDHTSHRLAALGLSDRASVVFLYVVAGLFAVLGIVAEALAGLVLPVAVLAAVALVLFGVFLAEVEVYPGLARPANAARSRVREAFSAYGRFGGELALDMVLLTLAYYLAYLIRFEGLPESAWMHLFVPSVAIVVGAQLSALVMLRAYRTLWRYIGVADAAVYLRGIALGTALAVLVLVLLYRFDEYSRSVFVLDAVLAAALLLGARSFALWLRHWFSARPRADRRRLLIVGATDGGAAAMRLLSGSTANAYVPVGFLDDDPGKRYRRVAGVPVVGRIEELERAVRELGADLVLIALDDAGSAERIRSTCASLGVEYRELTVVA